MTVLRAGSPTTTADRSAIAWLLTSNEPGIRLQVRRDLLGEQIVHPVEPVLDGPRMRALFDGQTADGGFGGHPYRKWAGAHWRLVSMVELGVPVGEPRALAAAETVLEWLAGHTHRDRVQIIAGHARRCASQEGNALAVSVRLGKADDERVRLLAESLVAWQWPDGGWNCDVRPAANHSSFNETVTPLWGLAEYARATGDADAATAARRACELLLDHGVYRSHRTGRVINAQWLKLRYPAYWHYDLLQGLLMLSRARALPDTRAAEALDVLRSKQRPDGCWHYEAAPYWKLGARSLNEVVDWGRTGASEMLTLNALRVLRAAST
jgi:hypothetical protein